MNKNLLQVFTELFLLLSLLLSFNCKIKKINTESVKTKLPIRQNLLTNLPRKRISPTMNSFQDSTSIKVRITSQITNNRKIAKVIFSEPVDTFYFDDALVNHISTIKNLHNKLNLVLLVDKNIPYGIVRYFELLFRENGITRFAYGNIYGENFINYTPTIPKKVYFDPFDKRKIYKQEAFNPSSVKLLNEYGIDSVMNCKIEFQKIKLKPKYHLIFNLSKDSISKASEIIHDLDDFLGNSGFNKKFVFLFTDDFKDFELFFNTHLTINQFYSDTWDKISRELHNLPYKEIELKHKKHIRSKYIKGYGTYHYPILKND